MTEPTDKLIPKIAISWGYFNILYNISMPPKKLSLVPLLLAVPHLATHCYAKESTT